MVRVYDPTRTDAANMFIRKCQEMFFENTNRIQEDTALVAIKDFLKDKEYDCFFNEFEKKNASFPTIQLLTSCPNSHFFFRKDGQQDYRYFQGYYDKDKNEINLCLQKIRNLFELKENLDRELQMAYEYRTQNKNLNKNEDYTCSTIKACKKQLDNYTNISENLKMNLTKQCARSLLLTRGPNSGQQPYDIWVRQTNLLIEENVYCYK